MKENKPLAQNGEIILYQPDSSIRLEVRMEEDTVWLNRQQMARLFDRDVKTIGKHINNALKEELSDYPVGTETHHPHRQLHRRLGAADAGEAERGRIGGDCHETRHGNAETRPGKA